VSEVGLGTCDVEGVPTPNAWSLLARRALQSRVVHFAAFGAVLFVALPRETDARTITLSRTQLDAMARLEADKKASTHEGELAPAVDERAIEDELLYREALRLGFDKDDPIVRQRLIQKTMYFAEELAGAGDDPSEEELRAFFEREKPRFRSPGAIHAFHIFDTDAGALADVAARLNAAGDLGKHPELGAPTPIPAEFTLTSEALAGALGADAAARFLNANGAGATRWVGPLPSPLGFHLLLVVDRRDGRDARFEEVRTPVRQACVVERRQRAIGAFLQRSFVDYRVTVDGAPVTGIHPGGRVAMRGATSGED
jgi:hypothetical protein